MPTNRQMEARDEFEAMRNRIKLIREGLITSLEGWSVSRRPPKVLVKAWGEQQHGGKKAPDFHIPASRPLRLKTATGVTSFHFAHRSVAKVTYATVVEGFRNKPGAARDHHRYIERETAVAELKV